MSELTESEREQAATALEQVLTDVKAGELTATTGQAAYLAGAVAGLRGDWEFTGE